MTALTPSTVARARLHSLLLLGEDRPTACGAIAAWFGAMQAQDVASGKWSLGVRLPGATEADIDDAFERAEVVRTWPMRGTIHIVPAADIRWMLELTAGRALDATLTRRKELGLDLDDAARACAVLDDELRLRGRLTRSECLQVLNEAGIATDGQRGYHLLGYAAQTGVVCIGPNRGKEQTYALIDTWAPQQVRLDGEAALAELAFRFFRSHGPATIRDFAGWSGLTLTRARAGVTANEGRLVPRRFRDDDAWLTADLAAMIEEGRTARWTAVVALPGFDEFVLGYKDRSVQVRDGDLDRIVPGGNGVFRATVCLDGQVAATWTRTIKRAEVLVELEPLREFSERQRQRIGRAFEAYGRYLGLPLRLR